VDLRGADANTQQREVIDRALARINTCMPGVVQSFDTATQRAIVLPGVKLKIFLDNSLSYLDLPPIVNVPVVFPFAGGFGCTLPVKAGDACLLVFSQRSIDNWLQSGGVQPPETDIPGARHHDLTDAIAIMGLAANPDVWGSWNAAGIELRNKARTSRVTVEEAAVGIAVNGMSILVDAVGINITAPLVTVTGNLMVTGTISDTNHAFDTHTHSDPQGGTTGGPN